MGFWTKEHVITVLPAFAVMILLSLLARRWLIGKSFERRMIPLKIIAVLLILLEVGKQICSARQGYNLYHIPLHFCSLFIYLLPLYAFYRGKGEGNVRSVASAAMTSLLFGMLVMPNVIYEAVRLEAFFTDYLAFHTVFFHNLVIFALFLSFSLDLHKPSGGRGEAAFILAFGIGFVALAAVVSHALETNYSNFLYSTVDAVDRLAEQLKLSIGEMPTTILYTAILAVLHLLLLLATNYIFLACCIAKEKLLAKNTPDRTAQRSRK